MHVFVSVPSHSVHNTRQSFVGQDFLGGDIIPRSILFAVFEGRQHVLCGMGDGSIFTFDMDVISGRTGIVM
jgi:DNA damage-binding protein 1